MRFIPRWKRAGALIAGIALVATSATALAAPPGTPGGLSPAQAAAPTHTVTLITGDVVRVHELGNGKSAADITRPPGAEGGVRVQTVNGDMFVFPDEALPHIARGTLDKRLFNVTDLIEARYDDTQFDGLPVIVTYAGGIMPRVATAPRGTKLTRSLPSISGAALTADKLQARDFWTEFTAPKARGAGLAKIWLDGRVKPSLATSVPQVGAPQAWAAGFDGAGTKVAVLDTGIDPAHPDLAGRLGQIQSFVPDESANDINGHGTHVASTIAGTGAGDGRHKGVAPGAELIVGKVLGGPDGYGLDSWIIAGMEWAVAQGADVVNMSLGSQEASDGTDPMAVAVNELSRTSDTLFVIAAGNNGCAGCIGSPGSADAALTVGAVDRNDQLTWFSNMGPRLKDSALKPDLTAPGEDISAAWSSFSPHGGPYRTISGTSMAAPHVAGAAAILAQQHPDWTDEQIKDALMSSAKPLPSYDAYQVGTGRLDVAGAVSSPIAATGSVYFGFFDWPHDGDAEISKTVTYTNAGDIPITLDLSIEGDLFQLSATTVQVPAKGSAAVSVTADPDQGTAGTNHLATLRATGPGGVLRSTTLGLAKEAERYSLEIKLTDRAGLAANGYVVLQLANDSWPYVLEVAGATTLRLPPQVYAASAFLDVPGDRPDSEAVAVLIEPEIKLDRDTSINLDARRAVQVDVRTPWPSEDRQRRITYYRKLSEVSELEDGWLPPVTLDTIYVTPTQQVTVGEMEYLTRWRRGAPNLTLFSHGDLRRIEHIVQMGSDLSDFVEWNVRAVFAGTGTEAEYAGVDALGKIVLIKRSDAVTPAQRSEAAVKAGARALIVVNDRPGKLTERGYSGLMVAGVTAYAGDPLIERAKAGRLRLFAAAIEWTPYTYDLVAPHPGRVPSDLSYRPSHEQLARIDASYHAVAPNAGAGLRYDGRPYTFRMVGFLERQTNPFERIEWVSTPEGTEYHEVNYAFYPDWESRGGVDVYTAGSRQRKDWFAPVVRPRLGLGAWQPIRYPGWDGTPDTATWTTINVTPWTDSGANHAGFLSGETLDFRLYSGDELLEQTQWQAIYVDLPVERRKYRLVMDASRPDSWVLSTRTHTEWQFHSEGPKGDEVEKIALLQLDYQVDTDLAGDVRAGRKQRIGLSASHMPGVVGAGKVTAATLEISFDEGGTWKRVTLRPAAGGGWYADVSLPPDASKFVSLRAAAHDDAGGSVSQEVIRAFGLR